MTDLFAYAAEHAGRYPYAPGAKARDTAKQAAREMGKRAPRLQDLCLEAIKARPMTADECAAAIGHSILSCRPRLSELDAQKLIRDSGQRRPNASGKAAIVWTTREGGQ